MSVRLHTRVEPEGGKRLKTSLQFSARRAGAAALLAMQFLPWTHFAKNVDKVWFVIAGIVIATVAFIIYVHGMLTKAGEDDQPAPHPVTWGGWTAISVVGVLISLMSHAGIAIIVPIYYLALTSGIFLFSLRAEYGKWEEVKVWQMYLASAAVALFFAWQALPWVPGWLAAGGIVAADAVISAIQVKTSWDKPWRESTASWVVSAPAALMGVFALDNRSFTAAAYTTYLALMIATVAFAQLVSPNTPEMRQHTMKARARAA